MFCQNICFLRRPLYDTLSFEAMWDTQQIRSPASKCDALPADREGRRNHLWVNIVVDFIIDQCSFIQQMKTKVCCLAESCESLNIYGVLFGQQGVAANVWMYCTVCNMCDSVFMSIKVSITLFIALASVCFIITRCRGGCLISISEFVLWKAWGVDACADTWCVPCPLLIGLFLAPIHFFNCAGGRLLHGGRFITRLEVLHWN
jgi:hypothetical protein